MKRETGFYWVFIDDIWQVAYYSDTYSAWQLTGKQDEYKDKDFDKITEARIPHPELLQSVYD